MIRRYTVTKDPKSGLWYAHMKGYNNTPVAGSFCKKRSDAAEYAKMYDYLPNRVEQIEKLRREQLENENRV